MVDGTFGKSTLYRPWLFKGSIQEARKRSAAQIAIYIPFVGACYEQVRTRRKRLYLYYLLLPHRRARDYAFEPLNKITNSVYMIFCALLTV